MWLCKSFRSKYGKVICHGDAIGLIKVKNWKEFFPFGEIYAIVTIDNFRMIKIVTKGENDNYYTLISKPTDSKKMNFHPTNKKKIPYYQCSKFRHLAIYFKIHKL
jgi:hypothetical protein